MKTNSMAASYWTISGAVLVAIATVFHPPLISPWPKNGSLFIIDNSKHWIADHFLMVIALSLWLVGLAFLSNTLFSGLSCIYSAALAIWLLILALEIAVLPFLARTIIATSGTNLGFLGELLVAFGLMGGYFATGFVWLGNILTSIYLKQFGYPNWLTSFGIWSGIIGIAGIIYVFFHSTGMVPFVILGITSAFPFGWTLLYSIYKMKSST